MERAEPDEAPLDRWAMEIALRELYRLAPRVYSFEDDYLARRLRRLTKQQRAFVVSGLEGWSGRLV